VKYFVTSGERTLEVEVIERSGILHVSVDGSPLDLHYSEVDRLGQVVVQLAGKTFGMSIEGDEHEAFVTLAGHGYALAIEDERERAAQLAAKAAGRGGGPLKAVMPGVVVELLVSEGETVSAGQPLLVLEAMKMQNEIQAQSDGVVERLHVKPGQAVSAGEVLATLVAIPESDS
jgi:glutaconyl-CoA/methylmalonyl-CoA decarboxylase subunit gamma